MFGTYAGKGPGVAPGGGVVAGKAGLTSGPGGWHPTVLYLVGLVALEFAAVALLSRYLLKE